MTESKLQKPGFSMHGLLQILSLSILIGILLVPFNGFAQQAFTPLQQGEYEVKEENVFFNPGIIVNGSYEAYYSAFKKDFITGDYISDGFMQDIELKIKSKVNTNLFVHAYIGNKSKSVSEQDDPFKTDYADEAGDSSSDNGMDLEFREAYLEYNHNPNAMLKIGKQFINIADQIGMIYQGRANAISQQCRIGTWCYYIGGARIGNEGSSALFWMQLDYPVYESGVVISDPWVEKGTRQEVSLNFELLRVDYQGSDIPLSKSGMWIADGSEYHDTSMDGSTEKYMYFENDGVQYLGFNLRWNYYNTTLRLSWINLAGSRDYWMKDPGASREFVRSQDIAGNSIYLETDYKIAKNWKVGLRALQSSGTEREDGEKVWENTSESYFEVQKGDFGDALIYFNGTEGLGQGHSISNLIYNSFAATYISEKEDIKIRFAFYSFKRNVPVYFNEIGAEEKTSTDIGSEFDFEVKWNIEESLSAGLQVASFSPGNAYSSNDNERPTEDPEDFSLVGINLQYHF